MRVTIRRGDAEATYDDPAAGVLDLPALVPQLLRLVPITAPEPVHVDATGQAVLAEELAPPGESPRLPIGFRPARP